MAFTTDPNIAVVPASQISLPGNEDFTLFFDSENDLHLTGAKNVNNVLTLVDYENGGGGGGTVNSVIAGDGITVDSTDPANPIVIANLLGSGTLNYIPKFTPDGSTIDDSQIFDDGANVGINIFSLLGAKLHVKGSASDVGTFTGLFENGLGHISLRIRNDGSVYNLGSGDDIDSTAFGINALINNVSGVNNTAIGASSLQLNVSGVNNSSFGKSSLANNLSDSNSAFGYLSLAFSNGVSNSAFGASSASSLTTGIQNSVFGADAMTFNAGAASNNTVMGYKAMFGGSGNNNTVIGDNALANSLSGNRSIAIGNKAGYWQPSASNKLFIDVIDRDDAANEIAESLIYGVFDADPLNQILAFNALKIVLTYLPSYPDNATAVTTLGVGSLYYTDVAGEHIIKITY